MERELPLSEQGEKENQRGKEGRRNQRDERFGMNSSLPSSYDREVPEVGSLSGGLDFEVTGDPDVIEGDGRVLG